MENNGTTGNKKEFLQSDRMFACSMLVFYGIYIIGLITITFWGESQRKQAASVNETATGAVIATQQTNATSTAITRATEQGQYEFIERFDIVSGRWFVGSYEKQNGDARIAIKDGVYIWDVVDPKGFTQATNFYKGNKIKDFDVYMDSKFSESSNFGAVCSGFFFRKPANDWNDGAYTFTICNDTRFAVSYYEKNGWQAITADYESAIQSADWNRIEISARGDHFTFAINNTDVFEMTDDRLKEGWLGIYIEVDDKNSAIIWFDNFGFQSR